MVKKKWHLCITIKRHWLFFPFSLRGKLWENFSLSSSYYGLTVWFPDMIKYLQKQEYSSRTKVFVKEKVEHVTFNFTLENQVHRQGEYFNDKWVVFYSSLVFAFWMTANPLELGFMSVRCLLVQCLMNEFIQTELACGGWQQMRCKYKWGSEMFYSKHWFDCMKALGTFSCSTSLSLMFPLTLPFQPELCMWFQMLQIYSIMLMPYLTLLW